MISKSKPLIFQNRSFTFWKSDSSKSIPDFSQKAGQKLKNGPILVNFYVGEKNLFGPVWKNIRGDETFQANRASKCKQLFVESLNFRLS